MYFTQMLILDGTVKVSGGIGCEKLETFITITKWMAEFRNMLIFFLESIMLPPLHFEPLFHELQEH